MEDSEKIMEQLGFGREKLDRIEDKLDSHIGEDQQKRSEIYKRLNHLEKAKVYFDGQKSGAAITISATVAAVVGAAIWIISKFNPTGS